MRFASPVVAVVPFLAACASSILLAIPTAAQPWADLAWSQRLRITVQPTQIEGTETFVDFPVLVSLNGTDHASIFANARPDGGDLLFTAGDGLTVLQREVVGYDSGAQTAEIWFRANLLSKTTNVFFLYYGNPGATQPSLPAGAWSSKYRAVYHFAGDPGAGVLKDSSPQGANATLDPIRNWTSSDVTAAQIHQGWFFNGTTHHINTRAISTSDSSYVVSAWLLHVDRSTDFVTQANPTYWHLSSQGNATSNKPDYARSNAWVGWYPNPIPLNQYHLFTWVFDGVGDTVLFYYDGEPQPVNATFPANLQPFYTGVPINPTHAEPVGVLSPMYYNTDDLMTGGGDEFRIREGILSPQWIKTEYRSQKAPGTFLAFGPGEVVTSVNYSVGSASLLSQNFPNPFQGGTSIRFNLANPGRVLLTVFDAAGREVVRLQNGAFGSGAHELYWDGRTALGERAAYGVYLLRLQTEDTSAAVKMLLVR